MKINFWNDLHAFIKNNLTIIIAIIMAIFTILLWLATSDYARASKKVVEMEKHRQTLLLCKEYRNWFVYENNLTKIDTFLFELKIWEGSLVDKYKKDSWNNLPHSVRLDKLLHNISVRRLFSFFEDAMILHQKELFDNTYFYNFFYNPFRRLENTNNPRVDEYIEAMRDMCNDSLVYEGYYYCRDKILFLYDKLNKNQKNGVEYVKRNEKMSVDEYREINKISYEKAKKELDMLVEMQIFIENKQYGKISYEL